jgi:hypothetical protein
MLKAMAGGTALGAAVRLASVEGRGASSATRARGRLSLAHRIPEEHWRADERFALLFKFLKSYPQAVDEVVLDEGSSFWTRLDQIERSNQVLARRIARLKEAGWPTGINFGLTMGHGDSDAPVPPLPFPATVGHDGAVSNSCPCINSPQYRAYITRKYALMALTHPDFLWMDDDLRASHHGPVYPCFCPLCLEMFGHGTDREALIKQLDAPAGGDLRRAWTEFRAATIESLCADVHRAIGEADSRVEIGLMTIGYSHSTYGGYAINRWMKALEARRGRPGHGYYTDEAPRTQLLNKSFDVGRQVRDYPPETDIIQFELEDYPHNPLEKAARTVTNECAIALMMGCTGIAFTLFPFAEVGYEAYERVFSAISSERPDWEALLEGRAGLGPAGFWPADSRMLMANRQVDSTGWFWEHGVYDIQQPNETAEMGLPLTTGPGPACGVLLAGKVAEAFSNDELRGFLAKGVLMDGLALEVLWTRGLGELAGVKLGERIPGGITERLTHHSLNGHYAGERRDILAGPADGIAKLEPVAQGVGDLAHLERYDGGDAGCCFSVYENALGGRVAVSTFGPWHRLGANATRQRLLAVADWLTRGKLPVLIEETVRTAPLIRLSPDGRKFALLLFNSGLDPTGPLTLRVRAQAREVRLLGQGKPALLAAQREGNDMVIRLPSVPAWQTAILLGS